MSKIVNSFKALESVSREMGKRKALGQHYLVDPMVVRQVIELACVKRGERVLEIGTGRGALTELLCEVSDRFEAFELDEANYLATRKRVRGMRVLLHLGDAFSASPVFDVLVSSLPYSESSAFIEWLSQRRYDRAIVVLQKEFVEKLMSPPGRRNYRAISVILQTSSTIRVVERIHREAFVPPPRVASVLAVIKSKRTLTPQQIGAVKMLFSQKKRKLGAALKHLGLERDVPSESLAKRIWDLPAPEIMGIIG